MGRGKYSTLSIYPTHDNPVNILQINRFEMEKLFLQDYQSSFQKGGVRGGRGEERGPIFNRQNILMPQQNKIEKKEINRLSIGINPYPVLNTNFQQRTNNQNKTKL